MKVRIKFSKVGPVKFIGHLDTMRYFQKALRRAELPVAYSSGFNPHIIMSFAAPLGVGTTSLGEYFDMELTEDVPTKVIEERLDAAMVEGFHIVSARKVEDGKASKAMSLVAAADYYVEFRAGKEPCENWQEKLIEFYALESIHVTKTTKKSVREIDIRPFIYELRLMDNGVFMKLASASANYTKPELVLDSFVNWLGFETKEFAYQVERREVYADNDPEGKHDFVSLEDLGEEVE